MRGGLGFLTLILAMAALKAALAVIVAAIGLALVVSFITRPRETIVLTVAVGAFGLAHTYPIPFAITAGIMWLVWAMMNVSRRGALEQRPIDRGPDSRLPSSDGHP